ncbi:uncharacterized protein LOC111715363 [Eurytemora carolleeae]|uniref:uncharacterized protein LOC111715363 n=1 Tax=Eurytemora carolleeae TaxID=1294199 RepID=UPI000C78EF95|nr:uncharacterized protein LOC111715363 [Eurytemora carolleeae]|eukprot:XP_023346444.1 uncharacterized protein LOC111715363 [Eurytemora affinis]
MFKYNKLGSLQSLISTTEQAEDILEVDKNESAPKEKDVPTKEKCEDEKPKEKKWVKADSDDEGKKESSLFRCIPKKKKIEDLEKTVNVSTNDDIVISGHQDFQSLYATNDMVTPSFTVNRLGAPNNSTVMCGCDNINCPFCNIVQSIRNRDPTLN